MILTLVQDTSDVLKLGLLAIEVPISAFATHADTNDQPNCIKPQPRPTPMVS